MTYAMGQRQYLRASVLLALGWAAVQGLFALGYARSTKRRRRTRFNGSPENYWRARHRSPADVPLEIFPLAARCHSSGC